MFIDVLGWLLAGIFLGVAITATGFAIHKERQLEEFWRWAWDLRRSQGYEPQGDRRPAIPQPAPAPVPVGIEPELAGFDGVLPDSVLSVIAAESETWRREELAEHARTMMREGANEMQVIVAMRAATE